jgi:hypothetical protein
MEEKIKTVEIKLEVDPVEEGIMKVTEEFIKGLRKVAEDQKKTKTVEQFINALAVEKPKPLNEPEYTAEELDSCEIELFEE